MLLSPVIKYCPAEAGHKEVISCALIRGITVVRRPLPHIFWEGWPGDEATEVFTIQCRNKPEQDWHISECSIYIVLWNISLIHVEIKA